ncbi:MAG: GNAT family N-acetyltransferase [Rhizobiaceae bacterium]
MTHYRLQLDDPYQSKLGFNPPVQEQDSDFLDFAGLEPELDIAVFDQPSAIEQDWLTMENDLGLGHVCSNWCLAWYQAHQDNVTISPFIIVGRNKQGGLEFLLPLELRHIGPMKVLVAPGAGHTTYYCGIYSQAILQLFRRGHGNGFWSRVLRNIGKIDALSIEGFSIDKFGPHHPLALLPQYPAAHSSMQMDISDDWAGQYEQRISPKLKADDRRCLKRLEELGEVDHVVAHTVEQRQQLLVHLLAQKASQFAAMNVVDPFRPEEVVEFYRNLIETDAGREESSLYISALTLNGVPLALNLGLLDDGECHGLITSMTDAQERRFSPGRLLLSRTNEYLSSIKIRTHDFGMGLLPYKSVWCHRELKRSHIQLSFSLMGRFYVWQQQSIQLFKTWLKAHAGIKRRLSAVLNFWSQLRNR